MIHPNIRLTLSVSCMVWRHVHLHEWMEEVKEMPSRKIVAKMFSILLTKQLKASEHEWMKKSFANIYLHAHDGEDEDDDDENNSEVTQRSQRSTNDNHQTVKCLPRFGQLKNT